MCGVTLGLRGFDVDRLARGGAPDDFLVGQVALSGRQFGSAGLAVDREVVEDLYGFPRHGFYGVTLRLLFSPAVVMDDGAAPVHGAVVIEAPVGRQPEN